MINTKEIFAYDKALLSEQVKYIAGIDEVGRGPLAGPVVTACVVMPYDSMIEDIFDSKKLSKKKREQLYDEILNKALSVSITSRDQNFIDSVNILNATKDAMKEAYLNSKVKPDLLLIDAVQLNIAPNEKAIIKGDATSYAIAAASIVAKVYRDRIMEEYDKIYPNYDFVNNVGYGTAKHIEAIKECGITPIHRLSFVKNFVSQQELELEEIRRERV